MNQPTMRNILSKIGSFSSFECLALSFPDVDPQELSVIWSIRNFFTVKALRSLTGLSQADSIGRLPRSGLA